MHIFHTFELFKVCTTSLPVVEAKTGIVAPKNSPATKVKAIVIKHSIIPIVWDLSFVETTTALSGKC